MSKMIEQLAEAIRYEAYGGRSPRWSGSDIRDVDYKDLANAAIKVVRKIISEERAKYRETRDHTNSGSEHHYACVAIEVLDFLEMELEK